MGVFQTQDAHALNRNASSQSALSDAAIEQLAQEFESFFATYFQTAPDGSLYVNEEKVISDGMEKDLAAFQALARGIEDANAVPGRTAPSNPSFGHGNMIAPLGFTDFAKCVALGALGIPIGNVPGLYAAFREGLRAWNWGLTARTVARILGPAAVKALGGPAGIALALGWAAVTCRDKL